MVDAMFHRDNPWNAEKKKGNAWRLGYFGDRRVASWSMGFLGSFGL
jgi:hypothetical protein